MNLTDEIIMAYVDGELDADGVAAVERAMRADPAVEEAVARARSLRERVRQAYAPVLSEQLPERLASLASGRAAPGRRIRTRHAGRTHSAWRGPQWAALAASLLLGVLVAPWLHDAIAPGQLRVSPEGLVADGALARALGTRLAADATAAGDVQVGLSFRGKDGRYCRSFALPAQGLAGLACRGDGQWRIPAVAEAAQAGGQLRLASTALPPAVLAEIDARLADDPLDAAGERAARDAGWE
jgi:anti-sigma factor RsiW